MLSFASIASGSNGNCYYIGNESEAVLVDVGLSCRELLRRVERLGLDMNRIRAIFLSHEHSDHISGLTVLSKKYRIPVFSTPGTWQGGRKATPAAGVQFIASNDIIDVGQLRVQAFPKFHDAAEPVSFVVSQNELRVGVMTDIGHACEEVIRHLPACQALFLESNYCEQMLAAGHYPYHLKQRISGHTGHLSNTQAFELVQAYAGPQLRYLILSHLSANNNRPEVVEELFSPLRERMEVFVASRHQESPIWRLSDDGLHPQG